MSRFAIITVLVALGIFFAAPAFAQTDEARATLDENQVSAAKKGEAQKGITLTSSAQNESLIKLFDAGPMSTVYLSENFENPFVGSPAAPPGWTQSRVVTLGDGIPEPDTSDGEKDWQRNVNTGVGTWLIVPNSTSPTQPSGTVSGTGVLWMNDWNFGPTGSLGFGSRRLESPTLNLSSSTSPYVRFWMYYPASAGTNDIRVMASSNGGATWNSIMIFGPNATLVGTMASATPYQRINVLVPTAYRTANAKIGMEFTNIYGVQNVWIDDLTVEDFTPTPITAAASGNWSASATWPGGLVPSADNDVTIPAGTAVTIDVTIARCQNLTVNGTLDFASTGTALQTFGNLTIGSTGVFNDYNATTGKTMFIGGSLSNAGSMDNSVGAPTTWFTGGSATSLTNTGTLVNSRFGGTVLFANPVGFTINSAVTMTGAISMVVGALNPGSNLTLGNPAVATTQTISIGRGSFSAAPTYASGMTSRSVTYTQFFAQPQNFVTITPGEEIETISSVRTVTGTLTITTFNNVSLGYPLTVGTATTGALTLTRGILVTTSTNLLTLGTFVTGSAGTAPSAATPPATPGSYVVGPLRINFPSTGTTSRNFALGLGTNFNGPTPSANVKKTATLATTVAWASQTITATLGAAPTGTVVSPMRSVFGVGTLRLNLNGGPDLSSKARLTWVGRNSTFGNNDAMVGTQAELALAQSPTPNAGTWTQRSPLSGTGAFANNTDYTRTTDTLAPGPIAPLATNGEYFGLGTTAIVPTVSGVARSTRGPLQGDSVVVTCTIADSAGITTANLLYASDGVAQTPVAMTRTSGTANNGTYRGVIPGSANQNGKRIEYQIQANNSSSQTTTTPITGANSYFAGFTPLLPTGVKAVAADRSMLYSGYYARVTGTINSPNYTVLSSRISYMFQDAFGGMNVNRGSTTLVLNVGDSITVLGVLGQFRGTIQLTPDSLSDIGTVATGRTVPIADVTVAGYNANPEIYESKLIRMIGLRRIRGTPAWGSNASIPVYQTQLSDSTLLFIDGDTPLPTITEPTYPVTVTGIAGQFTSNAALFNDGYEIIPRAANDFTSGLNGNYTIGVAGNFATLSRAIFVLDSAGVVGPVTFSFIDASYADTAQIILPYLGQGVGNTVTFKPASGVTPRILISGGSTVNAGTAVRMDSVSGIVWDGSNSGGTDRSLTIESDTNTTTARTPIFIRKGSRDVTLKNLIIKGNRHSAGGIPSCVVIDNTGFASSGGQNNMTVTNCQLMRGNNGLFVNAASGAVRDSNHTFTNNLIGGAASTSVLDHLAAAGITMTGNHNVLVQGNDINGIKVAGAPAGIRVNGANSAVSVLRNKIHNLVTLSGAFRPLCFLVGNIIATGPGVRTQAVIANNMIYDIHNFGTGTSGRAVDGLIYNPTGGANSANGVGSTIEWYYNSWNIDMAAGEGVGNTAFINDMNFAFSNPNAAHYDSVKFFNNVASVKRAGSDSLGARMWLIFGEGVAGANRMRSNNNDYYTNYPASFAQVPSPYPGGATSVFTATVGEFRDSTRLDSNSVFGNPQFVSATDAHISTTLATPVESGGRPIAGITVDFDGDTRNATTPDIGADEGNFIPLIAHDIGVASLGAAPGPDAPAGIPSMSRVARDLDAVYQGTQEAKDGDSDAQVQQDNTQRIMLKSTGDAATTSHEMRAGAEHLEAVPDVMEQGAATANMASEAYLFAATQMSALAPNAAAVPSHMGKSGASSVSMTPMSVTPGAFTPDAPMNFRARVQNYGNFVENSYQVGWSIDGAAQTPVSNTRPLTIGGLDTLILTWASATSGNHTARAWTILANDGNHSNDTAPPYSFTVGGVNPGDTLYTFLVPSQIILGVAKMGPSSKLVFTSGGQSSAVLTDNRYIVTTLRGAVLDTTHLQINNTSGQGFGFRDLAWNGRWLLTSDGPTVRRIDTTTFTEIQTAIPGPGTLQRGLAADGLNRIWKSNFTTDPIVVFDSTGATIRSYGIPTVAPYGLALDKWTSPNRMWLWMSEPSVAGTNRLSKVDTATGAIVQTFNYTSIVPAAATVGGLDIVNNHPQYPGRVVAFLVEQNFPSSVVLVIDLGPDSSAAQPTPGWVAQSSGVTGVALNAVKAVDQSTGWIAAAGGRVLRTVNTGSTWSSVGGGAIGTADVYAVDAINANTALVTTTPGATFLYRTTNGGTSWTQVYTSSASGAFIDAIKMFDANTGIALGDPTGGRWTLLRTSNGGATWTRDSLGAPVQVGTEAGSNNGLFTIGTNQYIWFPSNTTAPTIYRSTNGGTTWAFSTWPSTATFTAGIAFISPLIGVVGGNNGTAARTTDGGATWTAVTIGTGTTPIYAISATGTEFWATKGGQVYRSTDRGVTWTLSYTGTGTYNHMSWATSGGSGRGWAVSSDASIAAGFFTVTGVGDHGASEIPQSYSLMQNYPNPFNPSTTIQYGLPEESFVTLKIYNVLGQQVAQLRDEMQVAGYHTIVWDSHNAFGAQVATGIYFYRLEAKPASGKAFTSLKKMILLK